MDLLIISFIAALGYLIILCKIFTPEFVARTQVVWDLAFTLGIPLLFLGTFSGMTTAFLAGIWFSAMTFILGTLHPAKKERMIKL